MATLKLILLSKQLLLRRAMACFLNQHPNWEAVEEGDINLVYELVERNKGSLLLIDADFHESEIEKAIKQSRESGAYTVVFSCQNNTKRLIKLIPYHANGYLTADITPSEFTNLINQVVRGRTAISDSLIKEMIFEIGDTAAYFNSDNKKLTTREKEVLKQLSAGSTNRQIAKSLVISECTVKNHVHNILDKLQVNNRAELVSFAITNGLVSKK